MRYPRLIAVRASSRTALLIAAIHLVAAISFAHLSFEPRLHLAALLVLLLSAARSWWLVERDKEGCIELGDDGLLRFPDRDGEGLPCGRMSDFGVVRWIEWREGGRHRTFMLWRAQCSAEDWRMLGTWLRHRAAPRMSSFSGAA